MRDDEVLAFTKMLDATCHMLSRGAYKPDAQSSLMFFRALQRYEFAEVESAFNAHISDPTRGKFVPAPADIIAQINGLAADDGRPDPEEAWAMAFRAADEQATVVWTDEIAEAFGIARPVLDAGDEVGARMAFKGAYARLVDAARQQRRPIRWNASLGHNKAEQIEALRPHVASGRLPASMLALNAPSIGLLELAASPHAPESAREALQRVKERLLARMQAPSRDYIEKVQTDELKAVAQAKVDAFMREPQT